jgi:peptidoglycan/LPS O-acetylase OafA/YrhL
MAGTISESFNPRRNSLNFLRLALASIVLVSHAVLLAGFRVVDDINGTGFAEIAVYGFFGISGYLIAGGATRNRAGRYLWQRFLRIFPAFWICLLVTAFIFGVVGWLSQPAVAHCGLSCYFNARQNGPYSYVYKNLLLHIDQTSIAGTPRGSLLPLDWNGSLWTLYSEFLCYLILMALALVGLLRRRGVVLIATMALWAVVAVIALTPSLDDKFSVFDNFAAFSLLKFASVFMIGAVIFLYRERIPDSAWLALMCAGVYVASLYWQSPSTHFTTSDIFVPLVAYPLLWLGIHLPLHRIGARNDYSYRVYIYGVPVAQLLVIWGVEKWGLIPYTAMAIVCTIPLAVASWWAVEKHALKLKSLGMQTTAVSVPLATASRLLTQANDTVGPK